jgi:hypothetical protein
MARQIRSRIGWNGRNSHKSVRDGESLGVVRSILGLNKGADASCNVHGYIEDSKVHQGCTVVRETEVSLRRVRILQ